MTVKNEENEITKEDAQKIVDDMQTRFQNRATFIRLIGLAIVTAGFMFFVGLGSQNIPQYLVLFIMIIVSYLVGQSDMRQKFEERSLVALLEILDDAERIFFQETEEDDSEEE